MYTEWLGDLRRRLALTGKAGNGVSERNPGFAYEPLLAFYVDIVLAEARLKTGVDRVLQ